MRAILDTTVATIIDVQGRLHPHMWEAERQLDRTITLVRGLQVLEVPILVTEQYPQGLGETVPALRDTLDASYRPIIKSAFSCCDEPSYNEALKAHAPATVVLAGIETHVCMLQTTIDLCAQGYDVRIVVDATSSRNARDAEIALRRLEGEGARLTTVESILFELTRVSGTTRFKEISRLVK